MTLNYAGAKQAAHSYQQAKMAIIQHLKTSGFGQWLSLHEIYGTDTFFEEEKLWFFLDHCPENGWKVCAWNQLERTGLMKGSDSHDQ